MSDGLTMSFKVGWTTRARGRKQLYVGDAPPPPPPPRGRVPHVARIMALAIRLDQLLRAGEVKNLAEIARLGHVTRARASQIMNLLNLAPDLIEAILHLPPTLRGRHPIKEWQLRPIAQEPLWSKQRTMWRSLQMS